MAEWEVVPDDQATPQYQVQSTLGQLGYSPAAISGILTNLGRESKFDPAAVGDSGTSIGLAQWHKDRADALKQYAADNKANVDDPSVQARFLDKELKTKFPELRTKLLSAKDPAEAEQLFRTQFEKPKNAGWEVVEPSRSGQYWKPSQAVLNQPNTYWMSPDDYLNMRKPLEDPKNDAQWRSLEKSMNAGDEMVDAPKLVFGKDGKLEEDASDGRHRAIWAKEHGIEQIPVQIKGEMPVDDSGLPYLPKMNNYPGGAFHFQPTQEPKGPPPFIEEPKTFGEVAKNFYNYATLAAPLRGAVSIGQELTGRKPIPQTLSGDEMAALSLGAGATPAYGSGNALARMGAEEALKKINPNLAEASQAGLVFPPGTPGGLPLGRTMNVLTGLADKTKTEQRASLINSSKANQMAAEELGLPPETTLTHKVFTDFRAAKGKPYEELPKQLPHVAVDDAYEEVRTGLGGTRTEAAQEFGIKKNPDIEALRDELNKPGGFSTKAAVQKIRDLRHDAKINFKAEGDPGKEALANAQRSAANAIEDLIERNLEKEGKTAFLDDFRAARVAIAKSHDIEDATNPSSFNVDTRHFAKLLNKGAPLTGNLRILANAANLAPRAFRSPRDIGEISPYNMWDITRIGLSGFGGFYNPKEALAAGLVFGSRPFVREAMLGRFGQNALVPQVLPKPTRTGNFLKDMLTRY